MARIEAQDFARMEKSATEKIKARNRAEALIKDATARYIKEKTRARSKKLAMEKDAAINAPRFAKLAEYDRRDDIREAYGMGYITEKQADKLEDLCFFSGDTLFFGTLSPDGFCGGYPPTDGFEKELLAVREDWRSAQTAPEPLRLPNTLRKYTEQRT